MQRKKMALLDRLIEKKFGTDPLIEEPKKFKPKFGPPKERPVEKPKTK